MGRMHFNVRAALEGEQPETPETPEVDESETLAASQLEANEAGDEGEGIAEVLEDGVELGDELQGMEEKVETAADNGGLTEQSAEILQDAVESACFRFFKDNGGDFPALESFGGTGTRMSATTNALEGIRSRIADVWRAIWEFIKKMAARAMEIWNSFFGAAEKLKSRAEALVKRGTDTTGTQEKKELENPSLFAKLQIGGKVDVKAGVTTLLSAVTTSETVAKETAGEAEAMKAKYADPVKHIKEFSLKGDGGGFSKTGDTYGSAGDGMGWYASPKILGDRVFVIRGAAGKKTGLEALKAMARYEYSVRPADPKATAGAGGKKFAALTNSDVKAVAAEVAKIAEKAIAFRTLAKEYEGLLSELGKAANQAGEAAIKAQETKGEEKEIFNALRSAMGKWSTYLYNSISVPVKTAVTSGGDVLTYCEQSLKLYK